MLSSRVRHVSSFAELASTPFRDGVNALCWSRKLVGDFDEITTALATLAGPIDEITSLDEEALHALTLSPAGQRARAQLLSDLSLLREAGLEPNLDAIPAYPRDDTDAIVPTHVYSWHADSAPIIADTYLCSYTVACSEGLPNEHAVRRVDVPETRAALLALYGRRDDASFAGWLSEHHYDLHYAPLADAQPYSFGFGHLWRIANQCPGSPVPPCIHRAPTTLPGQPPRLLLIS